MPFKVVVDISEAEQYWRMTADGKALAGHASQTTGRSFARETLKTVGCLSCCASLCPPLCMQDPQTRRSSAAWASTALTRGQRAPGHPQTHSPPSCQAPRPLHAAWPQQSNAPATAWRPTQLPSWCGARHLLAVRLPAHSQPGLDMRRGFASLQCTSLLHLWTCIWRILRRGSAVWMSMWQPSRLLRLFSPTKSCRSSP